MPFETRKVVFEINVEEQNSLSEFLLEPNNMTKQKKLFAFALIVFISFVIAICQNFLPQGKSSANTISSADVLEAPVSDHIFISSAGLSKEHNAVWVQCSGHNIRSKVIFNGIVCHTTSYSDHVTALIPENVSLNAIETVEIQLYNVLENRKSKSFMIDGSSKSPNSLIQIKEFGYGDTLRNTVWVVCSGHTHNTKIIFNGRELHSVFYSDHITGAIPDSLFSEVPVYIQLVDIETKAKSAKKELK